MASRSRGRQLAVQVLYQYEYSGYPQDRVRELFWQGVKEDAGTRRFTDELVEGVLDCIDELDLEIGAYLKNWSLERIVSLDKIVLQLAFYELLYNQAVPWRVVVDEAVVLAKMYSGDKSATFINGILHAWATKNRPGDTGTQGDTSGVRHDANVTADDASGPASDDASSEGSEDAADDASHNASDGAPDAPSGDDAETPTA